jgi:hypothetical protein
MFADFRPPSRHRQFESERRRRPANPQWNRLPSFLGQFLVIGLVAIAGRTILRLRLTTTVPLDSPWSPRYPISTLPASPPQSSAD